MLYQGVQPCVLHCMHLGYEAQHGQYFSDSTSKQDFKHVILTKEIWSVEGCHSTLNPVLLVLSPTWFTVGFQLN